MLPNGRVERTREEKVGRLVASITGVYLVLLFIIPILLVSNTVPELSGRANRIDYATLDGWGSWGNQNNGLNGDIGHNQEEFGYFSWTALNPVAAFVYSFGDLNCHQKSERSWEVNGNQLAVCVRDVGLFLGLFIGALFWRSKGLNRWTVRDSFLSVFKDEQISSLYVKDRRMIAMVLFLSIGALPIGFDGFYQLLTDYESTNPIRLVTGTLAGFVLSWWFCAAISSKTMDFVDSSQVKLPADARLVFKD
ncbi:MAG: hypothetical protein CMA98_04610 [Euryarchaeota archaeon]|jgi:uncharacterized membrane protein|nr:hypothetical protein [Euryarchaeota archaeon]MDP6328609.1 DUF2085 domain-containing protein [Candidatus Thalassarchaeaceae archaeon]|tara:strand:- start:291 stop:1040 length:750 start_codon:yes stop_codon:yes gene_type:complete